MALLTAALLSVIQISLSFAFYQITMQGLITQFDENLVSVGAQVGMTLVNPDDVGDEDFNLQFNATGNAAETFLRDRLFFIRVVDLTAGSVIEQSADYSIPIHPPLGMESLDTLQIEGYPTQIVRVYTQRFAQDGHLALQVGQSLTDILATQSQMIRALIVFVGLTMVLTALSGWFLAHRALIPVSALTRTAREISEHDLSQRITTPLVDDELGRLGMVFNQMLDRIQGAFERQKQFTADAAHELRTPLSIMQAGLDVALEQERTVPAYQNTLESLRDEVVRMTQLTTSLLMLARSDAHQMTLKRQPADFSLLLHTVIDQFTGAADAKHLVIERVISSAIVVNMDEDRMIQLALNLLDNAIKYTPEGGMITVTLSQLDGRVQFDVSDTGIGIPPDHLLHIFDRFYRVDRARTRAQGGIGLGLAIARQIVELHGGTITASSQMGVGTTITVTLPTS